MIKEKPALKGHVHFMLRDADGNIKQEFWNHNLVVATGLGFVVSRMVGTASAVMSHLAVGTDGTAPVTGNTALGAEVARVALTSSTAVGSVVTYVASFPPGTGTAALQEAAILNAGAGGTMLARVTFPVINKGASDTLSVSWSIEATE